MKDKIRKEYLRRTRKLLETKLSSRNLIKGMNAWAVPLIRYSGPFLKWTRDDLKQMDQRTRKLMTIPETTLTDYMYLEKREEEDFAVPTDHRTNQMEYEKKDKYLNLVRELKKLRNMKVMIVPFVIGAFGTITKGLLKGLEDLEVGERVETIQMTALLRTARILRRVLETWGNLLSLKLLWKTIS